MTINAGNRVDDTTQKKSTLTSRNKNSKVFNTIDVSNSGIPQKILESSEQMAQVRFDSKGSKLSGDLEHLEAYTPGNKFARIYEDPLEKTASNFSYTRCPIEKEGTVFRRTKMEINQESAMTDIPKTQGVNVEEHSHGGLVLKKQ